MKKFLALLFVLVIFSCGKREEPLPDEFDAFVSIGFDGGVCEARYEKRTDCERLVLLSPDRLCGIEFTLADGVCTAKAGELSFESEHLKAVFDFLPVLSECEKTVGNREYRIYGIRGLE